MFKRFPAERKHFNGFVRSALVKRSDGVMEYWSGTRERAG